MAGANVPPTNERIVELLLELKDELAQASKREEQIARDLERLRAHT
jgi:hypothetical protein